MRGLKALLKHTTRGKLVKTRKYTAFRLLGSSNKPVGPKLRGVSKLLTEKTWSAGVHAQVSDGRKGPAWRGADGGRRRGAAVDAQVSRLAKVSANARSKAAMMRLTRMTFAALDHYGLVPIGSQRVVIDSKRRLATAADIVCTKNDDELVIVELKCGYSGSRKAGAVFKNRVCNMRGPLSSAKDTVLNRHLAQLAATHHLFTSEKGTIQALKRKGVKTVSGALLYVNEENTELFQLPAWWKKRAEKILEFIS